MGISFDIRSKESLKYAFCIYDSKDRGIIHWKAEFEAPAAPESTVAWDRVEIPFEDFISVRTP